MPGPEEATTREQMETDTGPALQSYLKSELPESLSWPGKLNRKLCPPGVFLLAPPDDTEKQRMYSGSSHSRAREYVQRCSLFSSWQQIHFNAVRLLSFVSCLHCGILRVRTHHDAFFASNHMNPRSYWIRAMTPGREACCDLFSSAARTQVQNT